MLQHIEEVGQAPACREPLSEQEPAKAILAGFFVDVLIRCWRFADGAFTLQSRLI
jgi:hypothetical protein